MRARTGCTFVVTAMAMTICGPPSASAAFAGTNGLLAYVSVVNNCSDVHTISADGTGDRKLTSCPAVVTDPSWNAAGNRLAVAMTTSGGSNGPGPLDLYTMDTTGGSVTRVTNDTVEDQSPSWSKDGSTLVDGRDRSGPDTVDIATVPSGGGVPTILVTGAPGDEAGQPQYSPDGSRIAFKQRNGPMDDLYVISADGTNRVDLTPGNDGNSAYPSWSPDGHFLAFASDRDGVFEIFVIDISGGATNGQIFQITHETTVPDIQPTWSPDQTMIAFTHGCSDNQCFGQNGRQNGDIDVVNVADLTHAGTPQVVVATSNPEYGADWGVACSTDCAPPPPTGVQRALTLSLKGALAASGVLSDETGQHPSCVAHQPVTVERYGSGSWHTIATVHTTSTGGYSASLPNRSGTYRAFSPAVALSAANLACLQATSNSRTVSVSHRRTIPQFNLAAKPDGSAMFANGQLEAKDRFDRCTTHAVVRIQRRSGSSWQTIATARGQSAGKDGLANFGVNVPIRNGEYRAFAPKVTLSTGDICGAASATTPWPPG